MKKAVKRTFGGLALIGGGLLLFTFLRRSEGLTDIYQEPRGGRFTKINLTGAEGVVKWAISNNSDVPIRISNLFAQYRYKGIKFGESDFNSRQDAPARQTTVIDIPVAITWGGLIQVAGNLVARLIKGEKLTLPEVQMVGKATINGLDYTFNEVISFTS